MCYIEHSVCIADPNLGPTCAEEQVGLFCF